VGPVTAVKIVLALVLLAAQHAYALDPHKLPTQYALRTWQAKDGLPQNSVQAVVQTRDGYIWLGTQEGLVRFDGVRFTVFDRSNTPALRSNYVFALHEDADGALWVGTNGGGLTRLRGGQFATFTTKHGLTSDIVLAIKQDAAGRLWLGTGRGVTLVSDGVFKPFEGDSALQSERVMAILHARDGSVWFASYSGGVGRWAQGVFSRITTQQGLSYNAVWSLYQDREGAMWAGTVGGGVNRLHGGRIEKYGARDGLGSDKVMGMLEDRHGNMWFATDGGGLVRRSGGRFMALTQAQGLANDTTWPLLEDREGLLWVGTLGGLSQLRDTPFIAVGPPEGAREDIVRAVIQDKSGALWIASQSRGVSRYQNGTFTHYTKAEGLANDAVRTVFADRAGNVWIGAAVGLSRLSQGRLRHYGRSEGLAGERVSAIHEDAQGTLWVGTFGGLNRLQGDRFIGYTTRDGLAHDRVMAIADRRAGGLWVGTEGGGLSIFENGRFTTYDEHHGLAHAIVQSLHEDADGKLWIGTGGGGLSRLHDGHFTTITTRQGLFDDVVHAIVDDGGGFLWISSNRGLQRVSKAELDEVAAGRRPALQGVVFGELDGLRSSEFNGATQPAAWRATDGRLWFPTMNGAVGVLPSLVAQAPAPRSVYLERAESGGLALGPDALVSPGAGALEFHYTALHFANPQRLHFRYRLQGFDTEWMDAGMRRSAYYTNIPPGKYVFQVSAALPGGEWSTQPAAMAFELLPRIDQTLWFRVLAVLLLASLLFAVHHQVMNRLRRRAAMLSALVAQREKAEAEARQLNAELESRVAARTADLQAANRALESFSYSVSHDLRAPLVTIDGFASALLSQEGQLDEQSRQTLKRIRAAGVRMSELINDLLRLAGVTRAELVREEVDLSAMARRIALGLHARDPRRPMRWEIQDGMKVSADAALLEIAMVNLLENAWKYTGRTEQPLVRVGMQGEGASAACFVADNGTGFDMAHAGELFKEFQRLHDSKDFPGTGIGLAIVRRIVERHGGTVRAEAAPGEGAAFLFTLGP